MTIPHYRELLTAMALLKRKKCARGECDVVFLPRTYTQRYHSKACKELEAHAKAYRTRVSRGTCPICSEPSTGTSQTCAYHAEEAALRATIARYRRELFATLLPQRRASIEERCAKRELALKQLRLVRQFSGEIKDLRGDVPKSDKGVRNG